MDLSKLTTEQRNINTYNLDTMSSLEIATIMNKEDEKVAKAIQTELPSISKAIDAIVNTFNNGGKLYYIGAGTSGRLAVLDASECPPTYGVPPEMVVGIIAGGDKALRFPSEGAEDSTEFGVSDLKKYNFTRNDILVGLAASGRTPYVIEALKYAKKLGAKTISVACNKNSSIGKEADIPIEVDTGPEVLTGSTRLKAGTATKLVLNMLSTGSMVRIGKAYQNLMVDVVPSNEKLVIRAHKIIEEATGVDEATAQTALKAANNSCKLAILMILTHSEVAEAKQLLEKSNGHISKAISLK